MELYLLEVFVYGRQLILSNKIWQKTLNLRHDLPYIDRYHFRKIKSTAVQNVPLGIKCPFHTISLGLSCNIRGPSLEIYLVQSQSYVRHLFSCACKHWTTFHWAVTALTECKCKYSCFVFAPNWLRGTLETQIGLTRMNFIGYVWSPAVQNCRGNWPSTRKQTTAFLTFWSIWPFRMNKMSSFRK